MVNILSLTDDEIYLIIFHTPFPDIIHFCQTNSRFFHLCNKKSRFRQLIADKFFDYLIKEYSSPEQALIEVSKTGNLSALNLLLARGVDPSNQHNLAIILASENGHHEIVERLLEDDRVNPLDRNNLAVKLASQNGHYDIVKLLFKYL